MYLFLKEKNKIIKRFFVLYSAFMLIILFNPIFKEIVNPIFKSTYWRLFWMLPIGIEIAYCAVSIINDQNSKIKKYVVLFSSIAIIMISGKFIYNNSNYFKLGNLYKLPDEDVQVTQLIGIDDESYKKVIAPTTVMPYIPQVDATVHLSNKREAESYNKVPEIMAMTTGDLDLLLKTANEKKCNYIILEKSMVFDGEITDYGFDIYTETEHYIVYKDMNFKYDNIKN